MTAAAVTAAVLAFVRPQVSLVAVPAHVQLDGAGAETVQVANRGAAPVVVDVTRAGFALDLRGRPRVIRAAPGRWLRFTPRRLAIAPGGSASLTVSGRLRRGSSPGDHTALLLLSTRRVRGAGLAVRMRLGVVVVLRVPGRIVHRLVLTTLRVRRHRHRRMLSVGLANRGNVTELIPGGRLTVTLWRRGRRVARLVAPARELLPRTRGIAELRYLGPVRGRVVARAELVLEPAHVLRRSFRLRL